MESTAQLFTRRSYQAINLDRIQDDRKEQGRRRRGSLGTDPTSKESSPKVEDPQYSCHPGMCADFVEQVGRAKPTILSLQRHCTEALCRSKRSFRRATCNASCNFLDVLLQATFSGGNERRGKKYGECPGQERCRCDMWDLTLFYLIIARHFHTRLRTLCSNMQCCVLSTRMHR